MIGIIGARFDEVQGLKDIMKKVKVEEKAGMQFYSGDLCGKDAVAKGIRAGDIIKHITAIAGGKGGGKPDSAMGGGNDVSKLKDALNAVEGFVRNKL